MNTKQAVQEGRTVLGIEFGSTRIKAVLVDENAHPIAQGGYDWENRYVDNIWSYTLGDIWKGVTHPEVQDKFRKCNAYARPDCKDCWAKLYCSGGCAANAYHATGDIAGVYEYGCQLFRKRMECAIMIQVAKQVQE